MFRHYHWVMLALLWLIYTSFGLVARSIFPLVSPILRDLHLSYSQMGMILGSWQLTYILAALVAGSVLDIWGVRRSIFAGAVIMGLSAMLRYFAHDFATMLVFVALFGAGGPMISVGGPKSISEWFSAGDRGTAVGIYMTGPWIGSLFSLSLTNSIVMPLVGNSWRHTFVGYGLVTFTIAGIWGFFARSKGSAVSEERSGIVEVFSGLIRIRNVQILLVTSLFTFAIAHGLTSWLPKILENSGLSASKAGFVASIPIVSGLPALLLIPRLVSPGFRGRFIALFALLNAMNLLMIFYASGALLYAGLIMMGFISSAFMPLMLLILMDLPEIGSRYMGSAGGIFFCIAEIGGFTGPLIMGVLVDITGTFLLGAFFLASLCVGICILTLFLKLGSQDTAQYQGAL
jgi:cyanate permease